MDEVELARLRALPDQEDSLVEVRAGTLRGLIKAYDIEVAGEGETGADLIKSERHRQVSRGHSRHDAQEGALVLQGAAEAFLKLATSLRFLECGEPECAKELRQKAFQCWPHHWNQNSFVSTVTRLEALIKAGALIAAQIDQMSASQEEPML
jgi:hypothetical protein